MDLFRLREKHRWPIGHHRGQVRPWNMVCLVFIGWVISYANEREDLRRSGDFQDLGHRPLLHLLTVPWNCPGTSGCVIAFADWGSRSGLVCHLGPIWFELVLCCVLGLCHSFKSCALPLSLLLQFVYLRQKQGRDTHLEKKELVSVWWGGGQ